MNIKDIALKVASELDDKHGLVERTRSSWPIAFAEALVAELAKENKPVYYLWENKYGDPQQMLSSNSGPHPEYVITALYTLPPTAEQIEQETAEEIAKLLENGNFLSKESLISLAANGAAKAIRSGAWKEYK